MGMIARMTAFIFAGLLAGCTAHTSSDAPSAHGTGLREFPAAGFGESYRLPDSKLTKYNRIYLDELRIEFDRGWISSQNMTDPYRLTDRDVQLIKNNLANEFRNIFTAKLTQSGRFQIVDTPDKTGLTLRPTILNLIINNPDNLQPYQSVTLAEVSASMTISLEVLDSASDETLLMLTDRGRTRDYINYSQQESIKNRADISKLLLDWSSALAVILETQ